jgi:hypothetical protein
MNSTFVTLNVGENLQLQLLQLMQEHSGWLAFDSRIVKVLHDHRYANADIAPTRTRSVLHVALSAIQEYIPYTRSRHRPTAIAHYALNLVK